MNPLIGKGDVSVWILVGSIFLLAGTVLHFIRAYKVSNAKKGASVPGADKLDLFGWGCLFVGALMTAVAAWAAFFTGS